MSSISYVRRAFLAVGLILFPALSQGAILSTHTNRAEWEALTSGRTDIDFSALGLAPGAFNLYNNSTGLTLGGVQFVGVAGANQLVALNPLPAWPEHFASGTLLRGPEFEAGSYILAVLPVGVTSFGVDLASVSPAGRTFRILLDGADAGTIVTQAPTSLTFFGVRTDTPITQVRLMLDNGVVASSFPLIDNVAYGIATGGSGGGGGGTTPAETPEVTTLLYAATGIVLIMWRKRKVHAQPVIL